MPITSTSTQNHPLAPRRKRATGFLVILVIMWTFLPEAVETIAMWIGLITSIRSLASSGLGETLAACSTRTAEQAKPYLNKLLAPIRRGRVILLAHMSWWSGPFTLHCRIA
ncbi:hypothetical protein ACWDUX_32265 [Streptomyces sp. NPDC003444]|uniref:hypothetical protein n=1 Tax=Streptomyces cinereoruber TaxID=67260 RepID=UPI003638AA71